MPQPIGAAGTDPLATTTSGLDPALLEPPDQMGQDTFLKLLVAQLKYQNPLDPMDGSEFMAQSAQFTTVERLNELTDQLTESLGNDRMTTATGMIGRHVTYAGPDGGETTDVVRAVRFELTGPLLLLAGGAEVPMAQVSQVSASAVPTTSPETDPTTTTDRTSDSTTDSTTTATA